MTQGRAIGKPVLILAAAVGLSLANAPDFWAAPPSHARNGKDDTTGQSEKKNGRWAEPSNSAPTISGTPATNVLQDDAYNFQPTAADPDGDLLYFGVSNLPRWASFDASSGRVFGIPGSGDIGSYGGIVIDVSDGQASAELPAFAIEVMPYANGVATLSWVAPTENTDGSPLLDLAGYEIHWGPESGTYSNWVKISSPGITTYVLENLTAGTHYFALKAISAEGTASSFSNEATKTIAP